MTSQPQNPEFRINPENFHPCGSVYKIQTPKKEEVENQQASLLCNILLKFVQKYADMF